MKKSKLAGHTFEFHIEAQDNDWLIPRLLIDGESVGLTQGRNDNEALHMIMDCFATALGIQYPWYSRVIPFIKRKLNLY